MERREDQERHASAESEDDGSTNEPKVDGGKHHRCRIATVYDAVAGKVWANRDGFDQSSGQQEEATKRQERRFLKHSTRLRPLAPDELLFQRKKAPERYSEHDAYRAHERELPAGGRDVLPRSDLLKAIHSYVSCYYGALARRQGRAGPGSQVDERSMDETALLAFGILLEEAGREMLGRRGHLVFTEGAVDGDEVACDDEPKPCVGYYADGSSWTTTKRGPKRQKLDPDEDWKAIESVPPATAESRVHPGRHGGHNLAYGPTYYTDAETDTLSTVAMSVGGTLHPELSEKAPKGMLEAADGDDAARVGRRGEADEKKKGRREGRKMALR